jgi:CTP synthase
MAGLKDAGHTEFDPATSCPLLVLVACPVENRPPGAPRLSGKLKIKVLPGSLAFRAYRQAAITEIFTCNYELNLQYRKMLEEKGLKVSGEMQDGAVRIIELPGHPFFIGTGFVPQLSSEADKPHPLIVAYLRAAVEYKER